MTLDAALPALAWPAKGLLFGQSARLAARYPSAMRLISYNIRSGYRGYGRNRLYRLCTLKRKAR